MLLVRSALPQLRLGGIYHFRQIGHGPERRAETRCHRWGKPFQALMLLHRVRYPHDVDGVADHIGGALLAFGGP
jgi:hypothetical protein